MGAMVRAKWRRGAGKGLLLMSICASGASTTKFGVPAALVVDQQYIQSILPPALAWLYPYLPYMHGLEIGNVGAFCALDPPTFAVPTAADIFDFITSGDISKVVSVTRFMEDITKYYLWYQLCQCTTGSTPAPSAAPSAPANLPAVNPTGYAAIPVPAACRHAVQSATVIGGVGTQQEFFDDNVPAAASSLVFTITGAVAGANHPTVTAYFEWYGARAPVVGTPIRTEATFPMVSGGAATLTYAVPAGARAFAVKAIVPAGGSTDTWAMVEDFYCGVAPAAPAPTPCPPDPAVRQLLSQIYDLLTLVQRQAVPFAYVPSAVHAGLTGDGSFAVSGLIGCKVNLTTIPASYGSAVGTPVEHFDLGFVTFGTPDGYPSSLRLEHQPSLFLPARCGAYTTLAYTLAPGVVATITELKREP